MKKIEAIIRKTKFEDVKEALLAADIEWFSYYDVRGEGKMRQARIYRGVMYDTSSIERVLLNVVVRDIAFQGSETGTWEWYWLQNKVEDSASTFAFVDNYGIADYDDASNSPGVRPVFLLS